MKFSMNAKEFKTITDKAMTVIPKKANSLLNRLYFTIDNGTLKVLGTDVEQYVEVRSSNIWNDNEGKFVIDTDDLKMINKLNGEVEFETTSNNGKEIINVKCGKKVVTIGNKLFDDDVLTLPELNKEKEIDVLKVKENWLLETLVNLSTYTTCDEYKNKNMMLINFNTKYNRVEALDGFRIGTRSLKNQEVLHVTTNPFETVKLKNKCVPVLKKLLDKKSENEIVISQDERFIKIRTNGKSGESFTYITNRYNSDFFRTENIIGFEPEYTYNVDRENMIEVTKYIDSINSSSDPRTMVTYAEGDTLYTYFQNARCTIMDEVKINNLEAKSDVYIAFKPEYLLDAFNMVDSDMPIIKGTKNKNPIMICGDEYEFLVLPVNINGSNAIENMKERLHKSENVA